MGGRGDGEKEEIDKRRRWRRRKLELSINKGVSTFVTSDIRLFLTHIELYLRIR